MSGTHRVTVALGTALLIAGWSISVSGQSGQNPAPTAVGSLSKDDDRAVRQVVAGFEVAWNAHDMTALARLFREDAEWVNIVGMPCCGRDEIMAAHTAFHQTTFKNHEYRTDTVETRLLAPGGAVAVATESVEGFTTSGGHVRPPARDRLSYVLVKGPDGWKIGHGHNVVVDEDAAKHNPVRKDRK